MGVEDGRIRKKKKQQALVRSLRSQGRRMPPGALTQQGEPKYRGAKSTLHIIGRLSSKQQLQLKSVIEQRSKGAIGWRTLQARMSGILGKPIGSHETARRISAEFIKYYG